MLSNEVSSEDSIASRSGVDEVVSTAGRLAAIYINELLEKPSSIEDPTPSFTRKFTQLVREVERRHVAKYDDMCNSLVINGRTVYIVFSQVSDELFKNGVNWGRVLGLYAFAGALCRACIEKGMSPSMDEEIRKWVVAYIRSNLATWMTDHGGWMGLDTHFKGTVQEKQHSYLHHWKVVGLAALGAVALYAAVK